MSGLVGMCTLDGGPVDRALLERMTQWLAFRGPDAQQVWSEGSVGFGYTLLATSPATAGQQPVTHEGVTVVADLRLDARSELIAALRSRGQDVSNSTSDATLLLCAYFVWGEECLNHLLGDFAFAIWDGRRRQLFCARDPFGIKPFFYAHLGTSFVFSNTLECLRLHPGISDRLNEQAIADFLLFESNQDPGTTVYADIRRLAPAHALTVSAEGTRLCKYADLPDEDPLNLRDPAAAVAQLRTLLSAAARDRLPEGPAVVLLSGGLDSTSVAAAALGWRRAEADSPALRALTVVYERVSDPERRYAPLAASALGIPLDFLPGDDFGPYQSADPPPPPAPEPVHDPFSSFSHAQLTAVAARARVAFTGNGGDPAFSSSLSAHFAGLARRRRFGRILRDLAQFMSAEGRLSRLYPRTRMRILARRVHPPDLFPPWLNEEFASRLHLRARWTEINRPGPLPRRAPRPSAFESFRSVQWAQMFELFDAGVTRLPLEFRHPFFDLRMISFLLRLPALPWCSDKELLRLALRGVLPEEVRLRPKTPLVADPLVVALRHDSSQWTSRLLRSGPLAPFVRVEQVPEVAGETDSNRAWMHLRPLSLQRWLQQVGNASREAHASPPRAAAFRAG